MSLHELVVQALGQERTRCMVEGTQRILERADAAPQGTDSLTHLLISLSSRDPGAKGRELQHLLNPDPSVEWNYVTFGTPEGKSFAKASPFFSQTAALGSQDWLITFTFSDLYMRLGAWWCTQLWRAAELAEGTRDALDRWAVLIAAACARSLLESAAYLAAEVPSLIEMWDSFKRSGSPTVDNLNGFIGGLNRRVTTFQYASRVGQGKKRPPKILSTNAMTYVEKLAKTATSIDVVDTYEWLCDAVHPSFGSATTYLISRLGDNAKSHIIETYARHPLKGIVNSPQRLEPTIAQKAADAVIFATDLLDQDLARIRWVIDDVGLTTDIAASLKLHVPLAQARPQRNCPCPCGSGRKYKRCVHRWGQPGTPLDDRG